VLVLLVVLCTAHTAFAFSAGVDVEDVVQLLDDFYRLKRLGFREALEQLGNDPITD
jgi:hypothetical protein